MGKVHILSKASNSHGKRGWFNPGNPKDDQC